MTPEGLVKCRCGNYHIASQVIERLEAIPKRIRYSKAFQELLKSIAREYGIEKLFLMDELCQVLGHRPIFRWNGDRLVLVNIHRKMLSIDSKDLKRLIDALKRVEVTPFLRRAVLYHIHAGIPLETTLTRIEIYRRTRFLRYTKATAPIQRLYGIPSHTGVYRRLMREGRLEEVEAILSHIIEEVEDMARIILYGVGTQYRSYRLTSGFNSEYDEPATLLGSLIKSYLTGIGPTISSHYRLFYEHLSQKALKYGYDPKEVMWIIDDLLILPSILSEKLRKFVYLLDRLNIPSIGGDVEHLLQPTHAIKETPYQRIGRG